MLVIDLAANKNFERIRRRHNVQLPPCCVPGCLFKGKYIPQYNFNFANVTLHNQDDSGSIAIRQHVYCPYHKRTDPDVDKRFKTCHDWQVFQEEYVLPRGLKIRPQDSFYTWLNLVNYLISSRQLPELPQNSLHLPQLVETL